MILQQYKDGYARHLALVLWGIQRGKKFPDILLA